MGAPAEEEETDAPSGKEATVSFVGPDLRHPATKKSVTIATLASNDLTELLNNVHHFLQSQIPLLCVVRLEDHEQPPEQLPALDHGLFLKAMPLDLEKYLIADVLDMLVHLLVKFIVSI